MAAPRRPRALVLAPTAELAQQVRGGDGNWEAGGSRSVFFGPCHSSRKEASWHSVGYIG